jgi:Radial spokehead-like protein
LSGA